MNKPKEPPLHPADALFAVHVPREPNAAMTELRILKPRSGVPKGEVILATSGNRLGKSMLLCELQRDIAIHHLQTILNKGLDATQMLQAEKDARDWLTSIGSEL
jgi:hypothetical protein